MSVPGPSLPGPQRASRKGPNPFLLIGIFFASSITFLTLTKKKQNEAEARGQKPVNPTSSLYLRSGREGEKIDYPPRRPVE
nr:hypothetical protein L203_02944 [Cryptococcus depauperatus CBS 7841]ODN97675.1 hypothetical protein L204_03098 [Cryptococcus depauperatus CBS 7855]